MLELLDADYTFVNERLAKHYGIRDVAGRSSGRVELTDRNRGGLLGMACVLTADFVSDADQPGAPRQVGAERVLGDNAPPPPPNVPRLADRRQDRRRPDASASDWKQHREKAECSVVPHRMDPLGFGLENYDRWAAGATEIAGQPVDSSGELTNGEKFAGPAD